MLRWPCRMSSPPLGTGEYDLMNFFFRATQFGLMHVWPAIVLSGAAGALQSEDVGFIAILMSVATLFRPLVGLSLGRTAIRFAGLAEKGAGVESARGTLSHALRLGLLTSIPSALLIAVVLAICWSIYDFRIDERTLWISGGFVYLFGLTELMDGLYRGLGNFRYLALSVLISRLIGITLIVITILERASVHDFVLSLLIAEAVCVSMLLLGLSRLFFHGTGKRHRAAASTAQLLRYSLPVIVNALSVYAYARAMVMIVGLYESDTNTGGFELAVQLANLPMAVTIVCATVLSPAVARLASGDAASCAKASELLSLGASISVWVNTVAAAYLLVVGPFVMAWLFPDLPAAPVVLVILAPLVAAKAYAQIILGEIAVVVGAAATGARITLSFGVVTVAAGFAAASAAGVVGAAIAMLVVHSLAVAASVVVLRRQTGMHLRYRGWPSIITAACAALPSLSIVTILRDNAFDAALWGSLIFLFALAIIILGFGRWFPSLKAPLLDGMTMLTTAGRGPVL